MILADHEIRRRIADRELEFSPDIDLNTQIQPASIDLLLGRGFRVQNKEARVKFDPADFSGPRLDEAFKLYQEQEQIELAPGEYIMGQTREHIWLPPDVAGLVEGRTTLARMGLTIHNTAPFLNPGWDGHITLEIANQGPIHIMLRAEMHICQIILLELTSTPALPYKGRHKGQTSPVE